FAVVGRERDRLFAIRFFGVDGRRRRNRERKRAGSEERAEEWRRIGHFASACGWSVPRTAELSLRILALLSSSSPTEWIIPRGSSIVTALSVLASSLSGITCRYSVVTVTGPAGLSP